MVETQTDILGLILEKLDQLTVGQKELEKKVSSIRYHVIRCDAPRRTSTAPLSSTQHFFIYLIYRRHR